MSAITPEFTIDLQNNVKRIAAREYERLVQPGKLWWTKVTRRRPSQSKTERLLWLLDTARIERVDPGSVNFEDAVSKSTEFEALFASAGLMIKKELLEDLFNGINGGEGLDLAAHWARQMGILAAYWPQKQVALAIRANPVTYDGKAYFATDHPVNPFKSAYGDYANLITAAVLNTAGLGATAARIDTGVTVDVAVENIQRVIAYAASIKMPNGEDPRGLRCVGLMVPPALAARAQQITNAKVIAQAAATGGGGADVEAIVRNWGFGDPIQADELGASFSGGSNTSYYMLMADAEADELPAFTYVDRQPFSIIAHTPATDADLARTREHQWTTAGRNVVGPGHPYNLFRVDNA